MTAVSIVSQHYDHEGGDVIAVRLHHADAVALAEHMWRKEAESQWAPRLPLGAGPQVNPPPPPVMAPSWVEEPGAGFLLSSARTSDVGVTFWQVERWEVIE